MDDLMGCVCRLCGGPRTGGVGLIPSILFMRSCRRKCRERRRSTVAAPPNAMGG